jgi:outer membrane protein
MPVRRDRVREAHEVASASGIGPRKAPKWSAWAGTAALVAALAILAVTVNRAVAEQPPATMPPSASSEDAAPPLSLADAVRTAIASNPMLLESTAQVDAARAGRREARVSWLPTIEIRETALRTNSPADAFGLQLMQERFSFPAFTMSDPNNPDAINNFATEFEARMPLFTGGKIRAGVHQATYMQEAAESMHAHTESAVELETAKAYMNTLLADRFVALAREARATTAKHVGQAEDFFAAGMLVESDLLQARVQLARMEENLVTAENGAQLARAGLNRVMGVGQGTSYVLDSELQGLDDELAPLDSVLARALRNRRDLDAMTARTEATREQIGQAQSDYWPEVGLMAKYALNDDKIFGANGDSYTIAAMARWVPWKWGATRARVSQARGQHVATSYAERGYREQVEFEARSAWQSVVEARSRHAAAEQAVNAAERAMAILEDRFGQGVARITELLDAETLTHEARVRETQARFDMQRAIRTVRFAEGGDPVPEVASTAGSEP